MSNVLLLLKYKRQIQISFGFLLTLESTPRMGKFSTLGFVPVSWARQLSGRSMGCCLEDTALPEVTLTIMAD